VYILHKQYSKKNVNTKYFYELIDYGRKGMPKKSKNATTQKDIYDMIEPEDLTYDMKMIASICGIDIVRKILRDLGGMNVYVPKITKFHRLVDRYLAENQHKKLKQLARELGVSETYLRYRG
jgi:AraC-like DNA-binding protein